MRPLAFYAVLFGFLAVDVSTALFAGDTVTWDGPFTIESSMVLYLHKNDLSFLKKAPEESTADTPSPPDIGEHIVVSVKIENNAYIRVYAKYEKESEKWNDKDGLYFTADYSTEPPRVILTKERTKYSEWMFEVTDRTNGFDAYVENKNDKGKPAWLAIAKEGDVYKDDGPNPVFVMACHTVLSYTKDTQFFFLDTVADGGK